MITFKKKRIITGQAHGKYTLKPYSGLSKRNHTPMLNKNTYKLKTHKSIYKSKQNIKRHKLHGGMGYHAKYWNQNPVFADVNLENENRLIISRNFNSRHTQYEKYVPMLNTFLKYDNEKYMINMDFTNNFIRNIFFDIDNKYGIDLSNPDKPEWINKENSRYKIDKVLGGLAHNNTTILFLSNKITPEDKKVVKIFNLFDVDVTQIKEYLSVEITQIGGEPRAKIQQNYIHYNTMEEFNLLNFNGKNYCINELSGFKTNNYESESESDIKIYLSCRNIDPINDFINNLIIKYISTKNINKINVIDYNNLFVAKIKTPDGEVYRYCLIMDKIDGSLDQYFIKQVNKYQDITPFASPFNEKPENKTDLVRHADRLYNYILQAEEMLNILKHPDYLFTHTDLKLENLFYKEEDDKITIYLGDFDKSSIALNGMRFYNNVLANPNNNLKFDLVQGFFSDYTIDSYTIKQYAERKIIITQGSGIYNYRLSRLGRKNIQAEPEELYMRYNNQPFYTSFDMISLLLSILHFRIGKEKYSLIDFNSDSDKRTLGDMLYIKLGYMNTTTYTELCKIYADLKENYKGNFGKLIDSILKLPDATLQNINFTHTYDSLQPTKLDYIYLTKNNKIGLSLPIVPTSIKQLGKITQFTIDVDGTKTRYKSLTTGLSLDNINISNFISTFIKYIENLLRENKLSVLNIEYSGDYSIEREMGSLLSIAKMPPPPYCIKTNKYSSLGTVYEWDIFTNETDFIKYCKMLLNLKDEQIGAVGQSELPSINSTTVP